MKRPALVFLVLVAFAMNVASQVRFTAETEKTNVAPGQQVMVVATLVSNKNLGGISPPAVPPNDAFDVLRVDQNQSQSSSIQIVNGRATHTNEIHYRFFYSIMPKKPGTFVFPVLSATIDGQTYSTQAIAFNTTSEPVRSADVKVYLSVSKRSLYAGEQAILSLKVAQRAQSPVQVQRGFGPAIERLEKAFGKEFALSRLFTNQVTTGSERIDGEMYTTYSLRFALFGVAPGDHSIPSLPFEYDELQRSQRRRVDPFFDDFFNMDMFGGVQAVPRSVVSNALSLQVKTLPPAPAKFGGTVGRATLAASADRTDLPAGEALTLKITVKAPTRAGSVGDVALPELPDCEVFTPERQVEVDTVASGFVTRKTLKYMVIPRQEGTLDISAISLAYFDPESGTYKTASSDPIAVRVTPGKAGARREQTRYLTQEEIREVGQDVRYIKTETRLRNQPAQPHRDPKFLLLYPLPLIAFVMALLYRIQRSRRLQQASAYLSRRALRDALREVGAVRKAGPRLSQSQFLGKTSTIIEKYISQKFGFAATGRTLDELKVELLSRQVDERVVAELTAFVEQIDSFRFGGAAFNEESRRAMLDKAVTFLTGLEKTPRRSMALRETAGAVCLVLGAALAADVAAAPVSIWFEQANRFYADQQYDSAAVYYQKVIESGFNNSAVFYNYGNALYRLKKVGPARLYYEKAAKLAPEDPDIRANIRFVKSSLIDKVPEPQRGFWGEVIYKLHTMIPLQNRLWLGFILLSLLSGALAGSLFVSRDLRLWLIYLSVLTGIALLFTGASAAASIYESEKVAHAIVMTPSLDARNEPDGGKILFTAHEGTRLRIRKAVEGWSLVSLPNGVSGWVESSSLGHI